MNHPEWGEAPEEDYLQAELFLRLLYPQPRARVLVDALRGMPVSIFSAIDIFRASNLSPEGYSKARIQDQLDNIGLGKRLGPILLVRSPDTNRLILARGYHRLCAVYSLNDDARVPCKIV